MSSEPCWRGHKKLTCFQKALEVKKRTTKKPRGLLKIPIWTRHSHGGHIVRQGNAD